MPKVVIGHLARHKLPPFPKLLQVYARSRCSFGPSAMMGRQSSIFAGKDEDSYGSCTYAGGVDNDNIHNIELYHRHHHYHHHRPEVLALMANVDKIKFVMEELETLEQLLEQETKGGDGCSSMHTNAPTARSIELRGSIKKLVTCPDFMQSLNRIECSMWVPVLGLSCEERALISLAREKVKTC